MYSRTELINRTRGYEFASERAVDSHVKNLRRKLEQAGAGADRIRAIYGVGYRFDA